MQEKSSTVHFDSAAKAAQACAASLDAWYAYIAPGDRFVHPREVLDHAGLTRAEKRAILAFWASDAHTVEGQPMLRCLVGDRAQPVQIDDILSALQRLDMVEVNDAPPAMSIAWRCHGGAFRPAQEAGLPSTTLH